MDRVIEEASVMGADAIFATRFTTATIAQGEAEMQAFGTAVKLN